MIFILTISSFASSNTEVDFNAEDYSEEELIEIMTRIQKVGSQFGYVYASDVLLVGEDIPAGHYEIWIEEDDIAKGQEMIDRINDGTTRHCGATTLCIVKWWTEHNNQGDYNHEDFYHDEYGVHKTITLKEGEYLWTDEHYGIEYEGFRIKYFPDKKSGLFE